MIDTISCNNCITDGGGIITLVGRNFGPSQEAMEQVGFNVTVDSQLCDSVLWLTQKSLTCSAPPGVGVNICVKVLLGGQTSNALCTLKYSPPEVTAVMLANTAGGVISVWGRNFGYSPNSPALWKVLLNVQKKAFYQDIGEFPECHSKHWFK
jgi:hypothetical protein